jgi:steroid delta-isomerase-like uncharacterized protein
MSEENKALARRWFEDLFNTGDLDAADEISAPDHIVHDPTLGDQPSGPEGDKQVVSLYRGAFPDANITVEDQVAENDEVLTRWTGRGTHEGELMGIPPSGNGVRLSGMTLNRISDGKIVETWTNYDALGMMRQIGAIPEPGQEEPGAQEKGKREEEKGLLDQAKDKLTGQ